MNRQWHSFSTRLRLVTLASLLLPLITSCGPSQGDIQTFLISFTVATATNPIDQLTFGVTYTGGGDFTGAGSNVDCSTSGNATGTSSFVDDDVDDLEIAVSAGDTLIDADEEVAVCTFESSVAPTSGNFTIGTVTAQDADGADETATITVAVSAASATSTSTSTTVAPDDGSPSTTTTSSSTTTTTTAP
ncbi:MAG: hypothetical protein ACI8TX_003307 [Hyphomicrobiaceae bacterium]|jgi:hypothetical protein